MLAQAICFMLIHAW
jgi:hypothetical protein